MKAVKSFADVRRQVVSKLTLILPGITVTSWGRAWACVENREMNLYGVDVKSVGNGVRKSITIAESATRICDSAKSAVVIEKCFILKWDRGLIQNLRPFKIIMKTIFHKEAALHLMSLSSF